MPRALASAFLVLLLVGSGGAVAHAGKPQIAILGLEVTDTGTGIDPQTTNVAKEITTELRQRAKAGTGQYVVAPGSEKELIDEKLLKNCDSEAAACMAAIGNDLGAEILMYGRIEKSSDKGQPVYKVYIKLLNVARKQIVSSTGETLPVANATPSGLASVARTWYGKLTGSSDGGTLVVRANADRGTVLLDEDEKGTLTSGTVTIPRVAEGRHTLAIEAQGFERYEATITIRNGETSSHGATLIELKKDVLRGGGDHKGGPDNGNGNGLIERGGTVSGGDEGGNGWHRTAVVSGVATGVFVVGFAGSWALLASNHSQDGESFNYSKDCTFDNKGNVTGGGWTCIHGGFLKTTTYVTGIAAVASAGLFAFSLYKSHKSHGSEHAERGHSTKSREASLVVTPIVSPDGGGATLRLDW